MTTDGSYGTSADATGAISAAPRPTPTPTPTNKPGSVGSGNGSGGGTGNGTGTGTGSGNGPGGLGRTFSPGDPRYGTPPSDPFKVPPSADGLVETQLPSLSPAGGGSQQVSGLVLTAADGSGGQLSDLDPSQDDASVEQPRGLGPASPVAIALLVAGVLLVLVASAASELTGLSLSPPTRPRRNPVTDEVYTAIFTIAEKLEIPVLVVTLLAVIVLLVEIGRFVGELVPRRRRKLPLLTKAATSARTDVAAGERKQATSALIDAAWSIAARRALGVFADAAGTPAGETRIAKQLADFDYGRQRRLNRTRLLVRLGPALGLMGTLIPLSPALEGLARGDVEALTENLRVAFSVTVIGILIGAVAFALSLARERMYGQDYSDLEYVAAVLTADEPTPSSATTPAKKATARKTPAKKAAATSTTGVTSKDVAVAVPATKAPARKRPARSAGSPARATDPDPKPTTDRDAATTTDASTRTPTAADYASDSEPSATSATEPTDRPATDRESPA